MKKASNIRSLRMILISVIGLYVLTIVFVAGFLAAGLMHHFENYIISESATLIGADCEQLEMNVNHYFEKIEKNASLLFADEAYYQYDATDESIEEYDKIQIENAIRDRIVDLGLMDNYVDFCIVYANNQTVGWQSKTMESLYANGDLYEDLSAQISDNKLEEAWCFGLKDNYDRMYYVKRINDNAILLTSFYSNELSHVFEFPSELDGMMIRLVNEEGMILYSSERTEIGKSVAEGYQDALRRNQKFALITDVAIVNADVCMNGWIVMCEMPKGTVTKGIEVLKDYAYGVAAVLSALTILVCILVLLGISKPVSGMVEDLSKQATVDELSGVLNKAAYTDIVGELLASHDAKQYALIMMDVDNFKRVNDTKGHVYGDQVIRRMGTFLRNNFPGEDVKIGRLGGDEFSLCAAYEEQDLEHIEKRLAIKLDYLYQEFALEFAKECEELQVSLSVGVSTSIDVERKFDVMYQAADEALYHSKNNGKNQYSFWRKESVDEKETNA